LKLINSEVRIENSSLCNAKCTICPRKSFARPKMTMDNLSFAKLVNQAHGLGAELISIFGYGEPLMDEDVAWKTSYVTNLEMDTFITTNAALLNTDMAYDLLKAGLTHIRFSVHGTFENYEKVHKGLKFNVVIRNIFNFIKVNEVVFDKQCEVSVTVIPMHGETVDEIRKFWDGKVDYLEIWEPHNFTQGKTFRKKNRGLKSCNRPHSGPVQINSDGTMMVCCFDYNGELTVGCTNVDSIEDILKGEAYNTIREKHWEGDLSGLICEGCDQLNVESESPLLYSSRDPECKIGKTSSTKFELKEI